MQSSDYYATLNSCMLLVMPITVLKVLPATFLILNLLLHSSLHFLHPLVAKAEFTLQRNSKAKLDIEKRTMNSF